MIVHTVESQMETLLIHHKKLHGTPAICPLNHDKIKQKCVIVKERLQVSSHLRWQIEEGTR